MFTSTEEIIKSSHYWLRLVICLNEHIRNAELNILFNEYKDKDYDGLPREPEALYSFFLSKINIIKKHCPKVLRQNQVDILLPNTQCLVQSSTLDITIITYLIRTFTGLVNSKGNWTKPSTNDSSKAAFIFRATDLRNTIFHYSDTTVMNTGEFEKLWSDAETILKGLQYPHSISDLKSMTLDPDGVIVNNAFRRYLEKEIANLQTKHESLKRSLVDVQQQCHGNAEITSKLEEKTRKMEEKITTLTNSFQRSVSNGEKNDVSDLINDIDAMHTDIDGIVQNSNEKFQEIFSKMKEMVETTNSKLLSLIMNNMCHLIDFIGNCGKIISGLILLLNKYERCL